MPRMLYVPTDRRCLAAITSGLQESESMTDDAPCWFALIEHRDSAYLREHADLLCRTGQVRQIRLGSAGSPPGPLKGLPH